MKNTFKLELLSQDENGTESFIDIYIKGSAIIGFYIPDKTTQHEDDQITIMLQGESITVKREKRILEYLVKEFVEPTKVTT